MRFRVYTLSSNQRRQSNLSGREPRAAVERGVLRKRRLLIEHLCQRQLLTSVSGIVFEDANQSLRLDANEAVLPARIVFIDSNDNGQLDENESLQLTDAAGRFDFQDISGDETIIRLFNGSSAALPFFPVQPFSSSSDIAFSGGTSITSLRDDHAFIVAGQLLVRADLETGTRDSTALPATPRAVQVLPDGRILVLADDDQGNHAFTIDANGSVTPIVLQSPAPLFGWQDVALDSSGNGVLIEQSDETTSVRAIAVGNTIAVGSTTTTVGAGTRATSGGEITTVISTPTDDGIRLRLWSNATGTEIGDGGVEISGGQKVLSYDDSSGLVLLRTANDSLALLDAAAGFAALQTYDNIPGPAVLDAARELLFTVSPNEAALRIIDLQSANTLGVFPINAVAVDSTSQIALDATTNKLLLLTVAGVAPISLRRSDVHRIKTGDDAVPYELLFALPRSADDNEAPFFSELPSLTTTEDNAVSISSPLLLTGAMDAENDKFVVLLDTDAEHGLVVVTPTGGFGYIPDDDFVGIDHFKVILHDGRSASPPIELSINVTAVNDPLVIDFVPNVVPENATANFVAATVVVSNVDGGQLAFLFDDPRFQVVGDTVIVTAGSRFDFETEPAVNVNVTAFNTTTGASVTKPLRFTIGDVDESIFDIQPDAATIDENRVGELIAEIVVVDDGEEHVYIFSVDDDRFVIVSRDLRLKPGISLDYEAEPTVTVNITATSATGATKTEPLVITVRDIAEQAGSLELSRDDVIELVRGASVGNVLVDGNPIGNGFIVTVDDTRFEVVGGLLKLRSTDFVRRADQQEVQVVVTIQDAAATFLPVSGTFVLEVLANANPFHNVSNPYDVNADGRVNPLDALLIINSISRHGGPGPITEFPSPDRFYDVNGDGFITPLDALLVINHINRQRRASGEREQSVPPSAPIAGDRLAPATQHLSAPPIAPISPQTAELLVVAVPELDDHSPAAKTTGSELLDLEKLRDQAIELLVTGELTNSDDVAAAIDDFLAE